MKATHAWFALAAGLALGAVSGCSSDRVELPLPFIETRDGPEQVVDPFDGGLRNVYPDPSAVELEEAGPSGVIPILPTLDGSVGEEPDSSGVIPILPTLDGATLDSGDEPM